MDIRCPSCSTLYEFEEDEIGPKGVNVRCSACGQVFKVRRAVAAPSERWIVKRESTGETIDFEDLSTLQRWIVEQKVSGRDLISKTGDTWRSLGSINELAAVFKVVDELNEPRNASRDTDGYLTASQRAPRTEAEGRGRGYTPTPSPQPAATSLMAGLDPRDPTPPQASASVAAAKPNNDSSSTSPFARERTDSKPMPAARGDEPTPAAVAHADYSMGTDDLWDDAPGISFAAPAIDEGRSSDYTSEYSDLRRGSRRWPIVLLAPLMLIAGALLIMTALGGQRGDEVDGDPIVDADVGTNDDAAAEGSGTAAEGSGETEGSGVAQGSGDVDSGSGDGEPAEADAGTPEEDTAAAANTEQDAGTQVAATERDTAREALRRDTRPPPTPERDTRPPPQRDTRPEPTRRDTAPQRREEPPESNDEPGGYDGLMGAGNDALRAGSYQDALNHFSNATDARPNSAEAHVGVARSYEAMGRHDLAAVRYERATNVNSRYTPAWFGLGEARRTSGDDAGACEAYARVLSIVRTGRSAERARSRIEDLGCE